MKKNLFTFLVLFLLATSMRSQKAAAIIYFDHGKATLNQESKTQLKALIEKMKMDKNSAITIAGFSDLTGSSESNLALSKKRAQSVSDYFTANGIEKNNITLQSFGEDKAIVKNEKDLRENRRVEIYIGTFKHNETKTFSGIFGKVWKQSLKHRFSETKVASNEELVLTGPEGTTIRIPANSLCRPNGELVRADVDIELTEYYKKSDILLANLHTASDSSMLETGGMINIVARSGGELLSLKKGSEMKIEFMVSKKEQGMEVFTGTNKGSQINWTRQTNQWLVYKSNIRMPYQSNGRRSYEGYDSSSTKKLSRMDKLILSSGQLGWINCDRFRNFENKTDLAVEIDPMYKPVVRLVFKDINSVMPGFTADNGISRVFNIPVGQKATIVVFGIVNETPYFISKDIEISENQVEKLTPKKTSFEALSAVLKKVN